MSYPTDDGLVSLGYVDEGEQYAWDVTELWHDPERDEFWVYEGSGCSCYYTYDDYSGKADLAGPYTFPRALAQLPRELKEDVLRTFKKEEA